MLQEHESPHSSVLQERESPHSSVLQERESPHSSVLQERESPDLDLSDEDELQQAFDIHSLIISSLQQEPMFTADEVISEIEGMMSEVPLTRTNHVAWSTPHTFAYM